jgi:diguanylate cyclase (GGDEF)-like protein
MALHGSSQSVPVLPQDQPRRLIVIAWMFASVVVALFIFAYVNISLLGAVRAYVQGESLWSKAQKDAVYALSRYALYADEADYNTYLFALAVNQGDSLARQELSKPQADLEVAHQGFAQGRNHVQDIPGMVFLFRHMRWMPDMERAISLWEAADQHIMDITRVGVRVRAAVLSGTLSKEQSQAFIAELHGINTTLTPLTDAFSFTLGQAARYYTYMVRLLMCAMVLVLLVCSWRFAHRLVRQHESMQAALQRGKSQLENVLQFAPLPLFITRVSDEAIVYLNAPAMAQFKVSWDDAIRMNPRDFYVDGADRDRLIDAARETGTVRGLELHLKDASGKPFWAQYSSQRVHYGGHECLMTALINIDEKKQVHDDLQYRAYHDELTGLPNRAMFMDVLKRALARMERKQGMCSILFLDLDHFKAVNDQLGHEMGDLLLRQVAQRIQACVRSSDMVARLGGDEFLILIEEHDGDAEVRNIAQKILDAVVPVYNLNGQQAEVTASVGISRYPQDGADLNRLIKTADLAMYQAKTHGKNNVQFYRPDN